MMNAKSDTHLPALDAARGVAALAVFIYHLQDYFGGLPMLKGSFLAVDLFFLMSGYVIALSYEEKLKNGHLSFARFMWIRCIRLYPLYLMASIIGFTYFLLKVMAKIDDAPTLDQLFGAVFGTILILPSPFTSSWGFTPYPFAPSAWSLSFELWFNIVYAICVVRLHNKYLLPLIVASAGLLVQQAITFNTLDLGWSIETSLGGIARFWFSFSIGVAIFRLRISEKAIWGSHLLMLAPVFMFVMIPRDNIGVGFLWIALAFPVSLIFGTHTVVGPVTSVICAHLGRLSYAVYILHAPLVLFVTGIFKAIMGNEWLENYTEFVGLSIVTIVLIAAIIGTYYIDEPLRRYLRKLTVRPSLAKS